jgi:ADP-ribose pyrophosphatase YjhB (NUDIX family)
MENNKFGLGVIVCIFNRDFSKIFLLKRNKAKRDLNKADWGNPGGRVEWGEKLAEACVREVKEESGIDLDPKQLKLLNIKEITENPIAPTVHFLQFIYATKIDDQIEEIILNEESDEYKWFNLKELPDKTLDPKEDLIKLSIAAKKKFSEDEN